MRIYQHEARERSIANNRVSCSVCSQMPKAKKRTTVTRQKDTRQKSGSQVRGRGGDTHQERSTSIQTQSPQSDSRTRSRAKNTTKQQNSANPTPKPRQKNGGKTATNKRTSRQQETLGTPSPKQRRLEQGRNLTEEDIPHLVDAFVKAQRRHKKAALEDTDEEVDTEEYDSDSSETTIPDEELSSKGIALYTVGELCIIYIMPGDLCMAVTVVCACVRACTL